VSRRKHELCMSATYDGATKLDTIGRLVRICEGRRRSANVDDGGARFEESESLSGLVTRLGDNEHYPYEGICQERAVGDISEYSNGRTRCGGVHRMVGRMWIRGFVGRNGGNHAKKLNIVVHGERKGWIVESKLKAGGGKVKGALLFLGWSRQVSSLWVPFIAMTRSLNYRSQPSHPPSLLCHVRCQKTGLCDCHWNGRLRKINLRSEIKCTSAFVLTARSPLYPQLGPCRNESFLRAQH
jgi:hypothetical protein